MKPEIQDASSRRHFLKLVTGTTIAASKLPLLGEASPHSSAVNRSLLRPQQEPVTEAYWQLVKEQFSVKPGLIPLNAANLCPSPHMVKNTVIRLTEDLEADVSSQNRAKFEKLREEARQKLADYLGASWSA